MTLWKRFRSRLVAILRHARMQSEMDAEMRFRIEACTQEMVAGTLRMEAVRRARIGFDGIERAKEGE